MIPRVLVDAWMTAKVGVIKVQFQKPDGRRLSGNFTLPRDAISLSIAMSVDSRTFEIWGTYWGKWGDLPMYARNDALHLYIYDERHNPQMRNPHNMIKFLTGR